MSDQETKLTALERDLVDWFVREAPHPNLPAQLESARPIRRAVSEVGSFVHFEVERTGEPAGGEGHVDVYPGPDVVAPALPKGAHTNLCVRDGFVDHLEIVTFGDPFREDLQEYELRD